MRDDGLHDTRQRLSQCVTTAFPMHDDGLHPVRLQPVENQRVTGGVAKGRKSPSVLPSFGVRKAVFRIAIWVHPQFWCMR